MRLSGFNLGVAHNTRLDGHEHIGGFIRWWKKHKHELPEAIGVCPITAWG